MSLEALKKALPEYAKDLKRNLGTLASEQALTHQQRAGAFPASAVSARHPCVTDAIFSVFAPFMTAEAVQAAKAAAAIMAMNNVYCRFTHLASDPTYRSMPAGFCKSVIGKPGVEKGDFELWWQAVSAINGCGTCVNAQERQMRAAGFSTEAIQAAVRIAWVIHAIAATFDGEAALGARHEEAA